MLARNSQPSFNAMGSFIIKSSIGEFWDCTEETAWKVSFKLLRGKVEMQPLSKATFCGLEHVNMYYKYLHSVW